MDVNVIDLPAELSIAEVTEWQQRFVEALASPAEIELNGADVARIDTAFLQLLALFFNDAKRRNKRLFWRAPSDVIIRNARQLGLSELLILID